MWSHSYPPYHDLMNSPIPESYVDSMPCDESLLVELGRVTWAAARLHSGVRDAINHHRGAPSDAPFDDTLGGALKDLKKLAARNHRNDQVEWVEKAGQPAVVLRNGVAHAVTYTAEDGRQALMGTRDHGSLRFQIPELREVTRRLIEASMSLPE